jgi:hypothetical protein
LLFKVPPCSHESLDLIEKCTLRYVHESIHQTWVQFCKFFDAVKLSSGSENPPNNGLSVRLVIIQKRMKNGIEEEKKMRKEK